jgi:hypothetical protein
MSQGNYADPREKVSFEIEPGMVFMDTRFDEPREIVIDYADRKGGVKFIDTEGDADRDEVYMMDSYSTFEANVGAGRYKPKRDESGEIVRKGWMGQIHRLKEQYEEDGGRTASHKAEAIEEVLSIIVDDTPADHNDTVPFEDINGVGSKAADALRSSGFSTKGDVRNASKQQIEDVPYMGTKNTENLLEYVNQ